MAAQVPYELVDVAVVPWGEVEGFEEVEEGEERVWQCCSRDVSLG
jgi:hypothetical protein